MNEQFRVQVRMNLFKNIRKHQIKQYVEIYFERTCLGVALCPDSGLSFRSYFELIRAGHKIV